MLSPADRAIVHRDAAIPGLALLLDPTAMLDVLRRDARATDVEAVAARYVRYKPGTNALVAYDVRVGGTTVVVHAKAHATGPAVPLPGSLRRAGSESVVDSSLGFGRVLLPEMCGRRVGVSQRRQGPRPGDDGHRRQSPGPDGARSGFAPRSWRRRTRRARVQAGASLRRCARHRRASRCGGARAGTWDDPAAGASGRDPFAPVAARPRPAPVAWHHDHELDRGRDLCGRSWHGATGARWRARSGGRSPHCTRCPLRGYPNREWPTSAARSMQPRACCPPSCQTSGWLPRTW